MIDWAVFRMMRATRIEQQAWSVVSDGLDKWVVHDLGRPLNRVSADWKTVINQTYERHFFSEHKMAQSYVTYRIHRAALMAVLCFWRKL